MSKQNRIARLASKIGISSQALQERIERRRNSIECAIGIDKGELLIEFAYTRNDIYTVNYQLTHDDLFNLMPVCVELAKKAIGLFLAFDFELISWGQRYDFEVPISDLEENYMIVPILKLTESEEETVISALEEGMTQIWEFAKSEFK